MRGMRYPNAVYRRLRRLDAWARPAPSPWTPRSAEEEAAEAWCNVCRWTGPAFCDLDHCESTWCPRCRSSARDRFLHWCLIDRAPPAPGQRLLETSPRGTQGYRLAMLSWFDYLPSDFDERGHKGLVRLDLQDIDLPDESLDLILSAHVLEHVPDTDRALAELHRVLRPGGRLLLQVPILQPTTAPPTTPEFHDDDTPVFWRFGFDLTERLRAVGFDCSLLCTETFKDVVSSGAAMWPGWDEGVPAGFEFDVVGIITGVEADELTPAVDRRREAQLGLFHGYMFLAWEARKAG